MMGYGRSNLHFTYWTYANPIIITPTKAPKIEPKTYPIFIYFWQLPDISVL